MTTIIVYKIKAYMYLFKIKIQKRIKLQIKSTKNDENSQVHVYITSATCILFYDFQFLLICSSGLL